MDRIDVAKQILSENGYKNTAPRKVLLEFLNNDENKHMSCDEIYEEISKDHPNIGIATVYRNMQLFEELGIAMKITLDDGVGRYEFRNLQDDVHQHHHLVCLKCNKLIEVKEDLLGELEEKLEEEHDFDIVDHDLKFYGYCNECREKEEMEK